MLSDALQVSRLFALLACLGLLAPRAAAQEVKPTAPPPVESDEVVRITTELVQTDLMVFDKQGKFVEGLNADQFDLRVDGRPQSIAFFERVRAGTVDEDAQLAAARGGSTRREGEKTGAVLPLDRGRTIFFFVDDIHLSVASHVRVRQTLLRFIDSELGQNDEAAIVSATGQPGFLQQLTGEKAVLRAAVSRLKPKPYSTRDGQMPPMSEAHALAIGRRDNSVLNFFVETLQRETPMMSRQNAEMLVEQRALSILSQTNFFAGNTLLSLQSLVRGCAPLPGRKVVFFISDGFLLDTHDGGMKGRLQDVTDAAARSGVVIYSVGALGLTPGMQDASSEAAFDPFGRLTGTDLSEQGTTQEPLHTLAAETGGRALVNTNALDASVERALEETSVYYLLAWRPEGVAGGSPKFRRIEASVKGRPDLKVIVRRGFFDSPRPEQPARNTKKKAGKEAATANAPKEGKELLAALMSRHPRGALPTSLALGYVSTPAYGPVLTASVGLDRELLNQLSAGAKDGARVDVAGAVYNDKGEALSAFKHELLVPIVPTQDSRHPVFYSHSFRLTSGLYQVRVAAFERKSGRAGSASQWIEVPPLGPGQFSMSSLFIGERPAARGTATRPTSSPEETVLLSVDRRFTLNSWIRFVLYVYNASGSANTPPDVALQVQMFRDDQPVFTAPLSKLKTADLTDLTRIPYAAELSLASFPAGRYVLQVTAIDRAARATASQRVNFVIE